MITVVVPVFNEKDNILPLLQEIDAAAKTLPITEIIYVDDKSTDESFALLTTLKAQYPALRALRHGSQSGQSAALWTGIEAARNDLIVTMDGDGQNNPADIAILFEAWQKNKAVTPKMIVLGEREKRHDNIIRRLSSRTANGVRAALLKDQTADTGCSLKLFRRQDYLRLPYFDHMHRFLPALMMREGVRLVHKKVSHRPRVHGVSKYGMLDRLLVGISDLLGVWWLQRRNRRTDAIEEAPDSLEQRKVS